MTDFVWPNSVRISSCDWRPINNSRNTPDTFDSGQQTATRPGDKLGCTVRVNNSSGAERAKLRALASVMRGRGNRCLLPDFAFTRRGSFPAPELLTNSDFSNGTTGWSGSNATIVASSGVLRTIASLNGFYGPVSSTVSVTQFMPYAGRIATRFGRLPSAGATYNPYFDDLTAAGAITSTIAVVAGSSRYDVGAAVTSASSLRTAPQMSPGTTMAGDFFDIHFISAARCALVDGGGNLLLRSQEFDNAAWLKSGATITANSTTAPDGSASGDTIVDSSLTQHYVSQAVTVPSTAADFSFSVSVAPGARSWVGLQLVESVASHAVLVSANVTTGALGTISVSGANIANVRAYIANQGGGWYRITVVARKVSAATTLTALVMIGEADNDVTFAATSGNALSIWGASLRADGMPNRGSTTTSAAVAIDATAQTGSGVYVKGLPVSTNGLLLAGDPVEINKILYPVASDLNSDAAGCGYLQLSFPPPRAIADNTPVIICRPMGRMIMMNDPEIPCVPGGFSDFEFNFVQDLAA